MDQDNEANRLIARASRYARLGVNAGALAARVGVNRLRGGGRETDARALASALGSMKGPLMKVAQMLTTIPDAVPADFAAELTKLQSQAPQRVLTVKAPVLRGLHLHAPAGELGLSRLSLLARLDETPL